MTVINKYTQHPPTDHPEPFTLVSIVIEDKSYQAFWNRIVWMVDISRDDYFEPYTENDLGYWYYGSDNPEKITT